MEKGKKDHNVASAKTQEPHSHSDDFMNKEEQNQPNIVISTKSMGTSSPSNDNAPSLNQQCPSNFQWPYTPSNNVELPNSSAKPCVSAQSLPSIAFSQWHQLPHFRPNPAIQQAHPLQSTTPFFLPQQVNAPTIFHPFTPLGTVNASWQVPGLVGGATFSKDQNQIPNICYQVGYAYPGFPGPWDPSSCWGHVQLSQSPANYTFPGAYGFSVRPSLVPDSSVSNGPSSQKGVIRPATKLSQKHQQLWEAQSAENVQLWTVIVQLQSEVADYKCRIMKLESEVSSLKHATEEPTAPVTRTAVSRQVSKRGRPRKSVVSADAIPSTDESPPRTQGRKPRAQIFENVILNKAENKVNSSNKTSGTQQEEENLSKMITNDIPNNMGTNGSNVVVPSSFTDQVPQEISQNQMCGVGLSSSLEMKNNDNKPRETNDAFAALAQQAKEIDHRSALASFLGPRNIGGLGWPYAITPEDTGRNIWNANSQGFYNNGSVIREEGKLIPGWSFANEEDASEEIEDAVVGSAKDENNEEMGEDGTSDGEEIACSKGENLPQFSNW